MGDDLYQVHSLYKCRDMYHCSICRWLHASSKCEIKICG